MDNSSAHPLGPAGTPSFRSLACSSSVGVLLTVLVAIVVFPVRARTRLRKRTAKLLERMGNLAFYLLGEFTQVRTPAPQQHT